MDINTDRPWIELSVTSRSRRKIRISSHYPFHRVNQRLELDRDAAVGYRLDIPAGGYVGWEPGETKTVRLVRYAGARGRDDEGRPVTRISAEEYRERYGPTTGDRIRLGDTDLWIRVGEDRAAPGDEPVWGYARNLRLRMAQADVPAGPSELDVVLAGAIVVDPVIGVVKADIGIKDGRIAGIGRAGSPDISDGIDLVVGPHTKPYMAHGHDRHPGWGGLARPHHRAGAAAAGAGRGYHHADHGRVRGAAVCDGAGPRRARGLAGQRRHAGAAPGRWRTGTWTRWSRPVRWASRSTRTTAPTRT